jgi:hypothetical protein
LVSAFGAGDWEIAELVEESLKSAVFVIVVPILS